MLILMDGKTKHILKEESLHTLLEIVRKKGSVQSTDLADSRSKPIQWNPSITATIGEQHDGRYTGVAVVEGFCV